MSYEVEKEGAVASDDQSRIDFETLHGFLTETYWARGIPRSIVEKSVRNSLSMGLYVDNQMIGFARAVTDYTTFAYLEDVFVLDNWRGKGLGVWIAQCLIAHPALRSIKLWMLGTKDAHGVYEKLGFGPLEDPSRIMIINDPDPYRR